AQMLVPQLQRRRDLAVVTAAVVGGGDVLTMMVQQIFDDVRRDAEVAQMGRSASSKIVEIETPDAVAEATIEQGLGVRPTNEAGTAVAEQKIAARARYRLDNLQ